MVHKPDLWDRLVNSKWPPGIATPSDAEAITGAKRLYRKAMGKPWRGPVTITSGNRHTWIRRGVLYVNPNYTWRPGWPGIVHAIAHYAHARKHPGDRPHSARQAYIERDLTDYALANGFLEGRLNRPKRQASKPDPVVSRYQRILARQSKWQTKLKRAENALAKVRKERRDYERRHGGRLAT